MCIYIISEYTRFPETIQIRLKVNRNKCNFNIWCRFSCQEAQTCTKLEEFSKSVSWAYHVVFETVDPLMHPHNGIWEDPLIIICRSMLLPVWSQ